MGMDQDEDQDHFFRCGFDEVRGLTCNSREETPGGPFPVSVSGDDQSLEEILQQVACGGPQPHHQIPQLDNLSLSPFAFTPPGSQMLTPAIGFPPENFTSWDLHFQGADVEHKASPSAAAGSPEAAMVAGVNKHAEADPSPSMTDNTTWDVFMPPSSFNTPPPPTNNSDPPAPSSEEAKDARGKGISRSHTQSTYSKRRAAEAHNEAEKKRRLRINKKMEELQQLVPNARQTNKASMLDDVVNYTKHMKAMAAQLRIPYMARMGMMMSGGAIGFIPVAGGGRAPSPSSQSRFLVPAPPPPPPAAAAASPFVPILPYYPYPYNNNPYVAQGAQPAMNIEMYNDMPRGSRSQQENELINNDTCQQNNAAQNHG